MVHEITMITNDVTVQLPQSGVRQIESAEFFSLAFGG